mmetsp:Transcript_551/g.2147  ORF Transcript_551/g.2147 Transcript_551/m.2147 type:complete len:241 (-) Transcript_551:3631-4353(-)
MFSTSVLERWPVAALQRASRSIARDVVNGSAPRNALSSRASWISTVALCCRPVHHNSLACSTARAMPGAGDAFSFAPGKSVDCKIPSAAAPAPRRKLALSSAARASNNASCAAPACPLARHSLACASQVYADASSAAVPSAAYATLRRAKIGSRVAIADGVRSRRGSQSPRRSIPEWPSRPSAAARAPPPPLLARFTPGVFFVRPEPAKLEMESRLTIASIASSASRIKCNCTTAGCARR